MKVLAVLEAGDWIPSGVVRALLYRDRFARDGFDVTFVARQPIETHRFLDSPRPQLLRHVFVRRRVREHLIARATKQRESEILRQAAGSDVVYLVKVLTLPLVRALRSSTRARLVLDFGDAVWFYEDGRKEQELQEILRIVDAVTTDNEVTASYIRRFNANCTVIPDSPQLEEFDRRRTTKPERDEIVVGWIGTPGTLYNLYVVWEALEVIASRHPNVRLRLVGVGHDPALRPPFEKVRWSARATYDQASMIDEILAMDIGLFPLQRVEKSAVRGILKAALYMCGEAAVVASPVGQVPELIRHGDNGMLAESSADWVEAIELLVRDRELRTRLAQGGLQTVRQQFTTEGSWQLLRSVLSQQP